MTKLEFKAEQYKKFIDVSLAHFNVELSDDQKFAITYELAGINQAIYDAHLETLPKVYKRGPGLWGYLSPSLIKMLDKQTDTALLEAMEKLK